MQNFLESFVTVLVVALSLGTAPGVAVATGDSSATGPISPAVVATWIVRGESTENRPLDLLVLWRGTPGWFTRGKGGGEQTGGTPSLGQTTIQVNRGGLNLELFFDARRRIARVAGQEVELLENNVILVDRVDSTDGPQVLGTRAIKVHLPDPVRIDVAFRGSPELQAFLRCDLRLDDPKLQPWIDLLCARMLSPQP